jgi:hypothetical protein
MAFEEGTAEITCSACKARHEVKWSRMPVREQVTLKCRACRAILFSGSSVRDYDQPTLIDNE